MLHIVFAKNMEQWTVRVAWLELQLLFKLAEEPETDQLLKDTASCTINVFVQQTLRMAEHKAGLIKIIGQNHNT